MEQPSRSRAPRWAAVVVCLICCGCGEASRESHIYFTATQGCERLLTCERIGQGQTYLNRQECLDSLQPFFSDLWPPARCEATRINATGLSSCQAFLETFPCETIIFESVRLRELCGADKVCTGTASSSG